MPGRVRGGFLRCPCTLRCEGPFFSFYRLILGDLIHSVGPKIYFWPRPTSGWAQSFLHKCLLGVPTEHPTSMASTLHLLPGPHTASPIRNRGSPAPPHPGSFPALSNSTLPAPSLQQCWTPSSPKTVLHPAAGSAFRRHTPHHATPLLKTHQRPHGSQVKSSLSLWLLRPTGPDYCPSGWPRFL